MSPQEPAVIMKPLKPFADEPHLRNISLSGQARWCGGDLDLQYHLQHPEDEVILSSGPTPQRRDGLWNHTCFEAFVSQPQQQGYWEINLSPNGDWNFYRLSAYRENLQPDAAIETLPMTVERSASGLKLCCTLPLGSLMDADSPLEISLTTVLEHPSQGCSFWAWKHSGEEADFHRRDSFTLLKPDQQS